MSYDSGEINLWAKGLSLGPAYIAERVRVEGTDRSALTHGGCLVKAVVAPELRKVVTMLFIAEHYLPFSFCHQVNSC